MEGTRISTKTTSRGRKSRIIILNINEKTDDVKLKLQKITELEKHRTNVIEIVRNSNATPFRCHGGIGYACCYCTKRFPIPSDLKLHIFEEHDKNDIFKMMKEKKMYCFHVKLDVTDLKCNICEESIDTPELLIDHLKDVHHKKFYTDIKNQILPFKFVDDGEGLKCFMCGSTFHKFKSLLQHMNTHYRNYICELCGAGFVTHFNLIEHAECHKRGSFKCGYCSKVFNTIRKKGYHEKNTHTDTATRIKCGCCNEKFKDYLRKERHMVEMHGFRSLEMKCEKCDKIFANRKRLKIHEKRIHSNYKPYKCTDCGKCFFTLLELENHKVRHTGLKKFECEICQKAYGRPRTSINTESRPMENKVIIIHIQGDHIDEEKQKLENITNLAKHKSNLVEILKNSNATPIRSHSDRGYACCFCTKQFLKPADLKKHTIEEHDENAIFGMIKRKKLYNFLIKLDITDLKCNICEESIDTLEQILDHLKNVHDKTIFSGIKDQILPFKFESESLKCVVCNTIFHKFMSLIQHMNKHYRNHICAECDVGFVCPGLLAQHSLTHKQGIFNCDFCPKVFKTLRNKQSHEKYAHTSGNKTRNKCGYCGEKFRDYMHKEKHLIESHGLKSSEVNCRACDRMFADRKKLNAHIKRVHLMEKRHKCPECEMAFFSTSSLNRHLVKHTGVKKFECNVCYKSYGRKNTLTEHLRIHDNDRRFKCEHCGQAFVQKCSWRSHMRSRHGEEV